MIGVIGFKKNRGKSRLGTISTEYMIGVKNCQAMVIMPDRYSKSRKYTVKDEVKNAMPRASTYSTSIITGKYSIATRFSPLPDIATTKNTTRNVSSILTNWLVTKAIGRTSRGKYIFFTMSCCDQMQVVPPETDVLKKIQGTSPINRYR